jgi:L-threonylcarbamoyladenylate synthase
MSDTAPTPVLPATDATALARAARCLRDGGLVAFATETVYGLGGDATSDAAVAKIFAAKGRPSFNPLIVHLAHAADAATLAEISPLAEALMRAFWPGPLTLVLPRRVDCPASLLVSAGLDSIALRVPAHPLAHALLVEIGRPIAAPSANPSGGVSPTRAAHVAEGLSGRIDLILDGGSCAVGVESTVLDLTGPHPCILRPGGVSTAALAAVLAGMHVALGTHPSAPIDAPDPQAPRSPGMLSSHYAPRAGVRLNADRVDADEALLAFGPHHPTGTPRVVLNLSASGDTTEAAANLFAHLRSLDAHGVRGIAVTPIPESGLGQAINDRLRRAAAPRPTQTAEPAA